MTERERICLEFLSDKMEATAQYIGMAIVNRMNGKGGSNFSSVATNVVGALRKRGLVTYLPDLRAWRITGAGRTALTSAERDT